MGTPVPLADVWLVSEPPAVTEPPPVTEPPAVHLVARLGDRPLITGSGLSPVHSDHPVFHPFYVSVTEINHNAKDKILEISCKLFTNDLETVLEKNLHTKVDLSSPADKKAAEGYIAAYIIKNLQIKVDGKPVPLQFVGSEKEQEATWSYFQVNNMPSVKNIALTNSLLYDGFDKEINIMHVSVGGDRKSGKLEYPATAIAFEWP